MGGKKTIIANGLSSAGDTSSIPKRSLKNRGTTYYITTGGTGYIPTNSNIIKTVKDVGKRALNKVRQVLYDRVDPYSYDIGEAISQLFYKGRDTKKGDIYDALWAKYLNRSNDAVGYKIDDYIQPAIYKPTKGNPIGNVYRLTSKSWNGNDDLNPLGDRQLYEMLKSKGKSKLGDGVGGTKTGLGTYTRSLGEDENGKYMSYYDEWDISPIGNKNGKEGKDQSFGIGTPFSVYDRRYYTDEEAKHIMEEYDKMFNSINDASKNQSIHHDIYIPKSYRSKKESGGKTNNSNNMPKYRIHLDEVKPYVIPTDNIQTVRPDTTDVEYPNFVFSRNNPNFGIYTGLGYNAYGEMIDYNNNGVPASQEYVIDKIKTKYYKNPSQRRVNNAKKAIGVRPDFKNGGSIHIDPSKKGTFTAAASKHNMSVQEFASRVLRNKENYSPAMVKKANFARNASKWH